MSTPIRPMVRTSNTGDIAEPVRPTRMVRLPPCLRLGSPLEVRRAMVYLLIRTAYRSYCQDICANLLTALCIDISEGSDRVAASAARERAVMLSPALIAVDRNSPVPLYYQVAQHLEQLIGSGELPPGTRLDNEIDL